MEYIETLPDVRAKGTKNIVMNRIIEVQRRAVTRDSFGSEVVSWTKLEEGRFPRHWL